jgi:hypothetical protein
VIEVSYWKYIATREQDDQHPKALLKSMRDAVDTFDARGYELAAVSNLPALEPQHQRRKRSGGTLAV